MPQELALYPAITARENLEVFGRFHGVRRAESTERVDWALEWTGPAGRAREPVERFSGGMRRRLNIAWGSVAFGLDLWSPRRLTGFALITAFTAGAAAAFGLLLSASCRTRARLNGVSVVVILVMSALGCSMFPRFLMPESLQRLGLLTFNGWALDGYRKVFWYDAGPAALWPQVLALSLMGGAFYAVAWITVHRRRLE